MKRKIGFGIIGLGGIANTHAIAILNSERCSLKGFYSSSEGKAASFADKYGGIAYTDYDEFLNNDEIEAVIIATVSGYHMEPALKAIEKGKHVLIEKPLEITAERCQAIIDAAKRKGVLASCIFQSRYYKAAKVIKDALDKGRFGKLVLVEAAVKWFRSQEYYDSAQWRGTWKLDGGGALMNQAIHAVDLLYWFGGEVEKIEGYTDTMNHERIEVEDNSAAVLRFKNGALGVITASTSIYPGYLKKIEVLGTEGSAIIEEDMLTEWRFKNETEEDEIIRNSYRTSESGSGATAPSGVRYKPHMYQIDSFAKAIMGEDKVMVISSEEAKRSVDIILGIYESNMTGKSIVL